MMRKIAVYLRPLRYLIKLFFYSPKYLYKRITSDFKSDLYSKKFKKSFHIVWCAGLAKSGTTLIEDILRELPAVQANNSFFRIYDNSNLDHIHGISNEMFNKCISNENQDRLEKEGGACIMYTHFADGFSQNGKISEKFKEQMKRLSNKDGWFVPVSSLLEFLKKQNKEHAISPKQRRELEWKWLFDKLIIGST